MPAAKPKIFVGIKAKGNARFFIESLTANLGDMPEVVNQYEGRTPEFPIPTDLIARFVQIRARIRVLSGTTQVSLYAWSSSLHDDPNTAQHDERWRRIATEIIGAAPVALSGSFDPLEVEK